MPSPDAGHRANGRGVRTSAAGAGDGPGLDDLPHSGTGAGATTRRTRYVIPLSDPFDVPLPTCVVGGVLGPEENDGPRPW